MKKDHGKIYHLVALISLVCATALAAALAYLHVMDRSALDSAKAGLDDCSALLEQLRAQHVKLGESFEQCKRKKQSLLYDRDELARNLSLQEAMPRGSLGDFFYGYDGFASSLRFEVQLTMEYLVAWKAEDDGLGIEPKLLHAKGEKRLLQGVYLGRRSNFAFGLVAVSDDDPSLQVPSWQDAFKTPAPEVVKRKWWVDKDVEYVADDPHVLRVLHLSVLRAGGRQAGAIMEGRVVRVWRQEGRGFSIMAVGTAQAEDGIDPGPPFLSEKAWLSSMGSLMLYPMTAPNGGLVLRKENLSAAYSRDRASSPGLNQSFDYYRAGWVRTGWDCIPGRIDVLFAPLPPGQQQALKPMIHSLVFPLLGRKALWLPFWSIRERLLAQEKPDLSLLPAYDMESLLLSSRASGMPSRQSGQWDESAFQSALYDLLKRKPSVD